MPLEQLRETCREVARLFGYDMISDWVMHINCRHSFVRGNRRLDAEFIEPSEIEELIEEFGEMPSDTSEEDEETRDMTVDITPVVDEDKALFHVFDGFDSFLFINSIYRIPVMYDNPDSDEIFIFEQMNEKDVASWSRLIIQLKDEGLDDATITWALADTGNIEDDVIGYLIANCEAIYVRAVTEGWFE